MTDIFNDQFFLEEIKIYLSKIIWSLFDIQINQVLLFFNLKESQMNVVCVGHNSWCLNHYDSFCEILPAKWIQVDLCENCSSDSSLFRQNSQQLSSLSDYEIGIHHHTLFRRILFFPCYMTSTCRAVKKSPDDLTYLLAAPFKISTNLKRPDLLVIVLYHQER